MSSRRDDRPVIALVTGHWGNQTDESTEAVRLLAGALVRAARVEVVHLDPDRAVAEDELDSVFVVHHLPLRGARPRTAAVLRGALFAARGEAALPQSLEGTLATLGGQVHGLGELLGTIRPQVIVLAGLPLPFDPSELEESGASRIVCCPLLADLAILTEPSVFAFLEIADAIGSLHPGEDAALRAALGERAGLVRPLDIALTLNRSSTEQGLFGVAWFGRYVLSLRRFPVSAPRYERSVTRELLRSVLGPIAIAEVDGTKWRVTDFENTAELPVNPTWINLWRLMAHAEFTVDLRPPSPFGREAIESMLLSSPPIVPERSAAAAHVEAAVGGVTYRDLGDVLDLSRLLLDDDELRGGLARQGRAYATSHHEQMDDFVERTRALALG